MPKKRATRINKHAKPKAPEGDISGDLDRAEKLKKLNTFLCDFDVEVNNRLEQIEKEKHRLQSLIEKQINLQISHLPMEIRKMNIMDFVDAGGTVEAALMKLSEAGEGDSFVESELTVKETILANKKERANRKGKGPVAKTNMAPPSSVKASGRIRSKFQTPANRQLPAVWDTPAITPKFDINLPFTPGFARAPKHGEKAMSMAGSPLDITATYKTQRTLKHIHIHEEEELEREVSRVAAAVPNLSKTDIHKILSEFTAGRKTSQ